MQLCKAFEAHVLSEPEQPWSAVVHYIVHNMVHYMVHYIAGGALHQVRPAAAGTYGGSLYHTWLQPLVIYAQSPLRTFAASTTCGYLPGSPRRCRLPSVARRSSTAP